MKVVINQSNYLPWKGYFDLIHDADLFIFHDDLQYTKNDWRNRNRIKTARGLEWLTIPVGTNEHRLINEVSLPADDTWRQTHWQKLQQSYRDAPYFEKYEPFFKDIYLSRSWKNLSEINQYLITILSRDVLGIKTIFVDSTQFALTSRKQQRVLDLLKNVGADTYLSGPAAKAYLEPQQFGAAGVQLEWKEYEGYPEYPQFFAPFEHSTSIVDLLFQTGPAAPDYIWGWRDKTVRPS